MDISKKTSIGTSNKSHYDCNKSIKREKSRKRSRSQGTLVLYLSCLIKLFYMNKLVFHSCLLYIIKHSSDYLWML